MNALGLSNPMDKLLLTGLLFLFTLLSGLWLSNSGKPYSSLFFNSHKLIAVGTIIFLVVNIIRISKADGFPSGLAVMAILVSGLLLLGLIASGGLLSLDISLSGMSLKVHQIAPVMAVAASMAALFLLLQARP